MAVTTNPSTNGPGGATNSGGPGGSVTSADITDATPAGRQVLTAPDAAAQRTAMGATALTTAQTTAGATGPVGQTAAGALVSLTGTTIATHNAATSALAIPGDFAAGGTTFSSITAPSGSYAYVRVRAGGQNLVGIGSLNGSVPQVVVQSTGAYGWSTNADAFSSVYDLMLQRGGPGILAQRNGPAAQALRIYNTWTDASNGEWFQIGAQITTDVFTIGPRANGTGTVRPVTAVGAWTFASGTLISSGSVNGGFAIQGGASSTSYVEAVGSTLLCTDGLGIRVSINRSSTNSVGLTSTGLYGFGSTPNNSSPVSFDVALGRSAAGVAELNNGTPGQFRDLRLRNLIASQYVEGAEMAAPAAPASNGFRIYAEDNGSGKTRLMCLFASGAAQQLAIEP